MSILNLLSTSKLKPRYINRTSTEPKLPRMKSLSLGAKIGLGFGSLVALLLAIGAFYGRSGAAISIPAPRPLPKPNGYNVYVAAARALAIPNPPVDAIQTKTSLPPAQAKLFYTPARRQKWIAANSKSWRLLALATRIPTRRPALRGATSDLTSDDKALRELARGQFIRIGEFKAQKQWDAALTTGLDTLQMGRDTERGADLIHSLVGIAIEAIGERALQDVPSHLSATEAENGARRLERLIAGATPFSAVLTEDKWVYNSFLEAEWGKPGNDGAGVLGRFLFPKARVVRSYAAMMDKLIAQADKPALAQTKIEEPALWNFHNRILYPVLARSFWNNQRRQTLENLLLLRLALRAYRLENGAYPTKIELLAPKYLSKTPIDAFGNGEILRYRKSGDSYSLWSIGPDGIDNNGAPILNKLGRRPRFFVPESRGDAEAGP